MRALTQGLWLTSEEEHRASLSPQAPTRKLICKNKFFLAETDLNRVKYKLGTAVHAYNTCILEGYHRKVASSSPNWAN